MKKASNNLSGVFPALMALAMITVSSCNNKSSDPVLPPIGGYNNSNEVASANLKAHWTFDGTSNESVLGTAPTTSLRASYVTGVKGQALHLDSGYLLYPAVANSSALGSNTVSAWIYTDNQGAGSRPTSVYTMALPGAATTDWNTGPINMYLENGRPTTYDDTLVLHSAIATYIAGTRYGGDNINDYGTREVDFKTVKGTNKWVHYVLVYDGANSNLDIYANGVLVSNNNFRHKTYGASVGFGVIALPTGVTTTQSLIGAFPNTTTGFSGSVLQSWQGLYRGNIDELRIYNKVLTTAEISALYQLELAGR